ncbi:hypothetical protein HA45_20675 [Pantoea rodasii]|nr:hypothetical protein HA45_20675 [Pantoea rodasii]
MYLKAPALRVFLTGLAQAGHYRGSLIIARVFQPALPLLRVSGTARRIALPRAPQPGEPDGVYFLCRHKLSLPAPQSCDCLFTPVDPEEYSGQQHQSRTQ